VSNLPARQDRTLPVDDQGVLEPNYYCRSWCEEREDKGVSKPAHYCRHRAGWRTDHPGTGRCTLHGGSTPIRHGIYSKIHHERLADLVREAEQKQDPLDTLGELALARALVVDFINRHEQYTEALLAWYASFSKTARPIAAEKEEAFRSVVAEYEILLEEARDGGTDGQLSDVKLAREYIDALSAQDDAERPRKVSDIADAAKILDVISKMVERIEKARNANAISAKDLSTLLQGLAGVLVMNLSQGEAVLQRLDMRPTVDVEGAAVPLFDHLATTIRAEWNALVVRRAQ
jgi:hypothetical protein